jgi:predicted nucleic acid-binding protein
MATRADDKELINFIEDYTLMGKGLGYIDIHLLMSALLTKVPLWTIDKRLHEISLQLRLTH